MDSPRSASQPTNQMPKAAAWAVIIVIVLVLGVGGYFLLRNDNSNTNNNSITSNTNQTLNTNTITNINSNTNALFNSNLDNNTNTITNSNTNLDTTGWNSFTNDKLGFRIKLPPSWVSMNESTSDGVPYAQYTDKSFQNADTEYPDIVISKYSVAQNQNLEAWVDSRIKATGFSTATSNISTMKGVVGFQYQLSSTEREYAFEMNNSIYVLSVGHFQRMDISAIGEASMKSFEIL